jgi:hypothetical protein
MKLTVKQDPRNKKTLKLVGELPERAQAIIKTLPQMVAHDVLEMIQSMAPRGIDGYPKMLRVRDLPSVQGWELTGILPPGWAASHRLRSEDVKRTVLYIKPKTRRGEVVEQAAVVLSRHNPWTMDTLPWEPDRTEASIMSRRVKEKEARQIESWRRSELPAVRNELLSLGVTLRPVAKVLLSRRVTRDIAFEVLRYEFGVPPVQGRAHWKPAIRAARVSVVKRVMKRLAPWLNNPSNMRFESAKDLQYEKASVLKRVQRFQDLVGGRGQQ